jgi:hypothetical protein
VDNCIFKVGAMDLEISSWRMTFQIKSILTSWGSCNTVPQIEWLNQQKFIILRFWRLKVPKLGVGRIDLAEVKKKTCFLSVPRLLVVF